MRPSARGTETKRDRKEKAQALPAAADTKPRPFVVGLMGLGTVGSGVCRLLAEQGHRLSDRHGITFRIARVLVRDPSRPRKHLPAGVPVTGAAEPFLRERYDAVLECMGGVEPAGRYVASFLSRGVPVVTANKALLAERGEELHALAARNGTLLRYEASVAAGIPVLGVVERALQAGRVRGIQAILNGTSNFLFTRMEEGTSFEDALGEARRRGYAEADPTLDLSSMDAAQKLAVLCRALGACLPHAAQEVTGITHVAPADFARARAFGASLKPVAVAVLHGPTPRGFVAPALVRTNHPLAGVAGANCGVLLACEPAGDLFLAGPGAGALPTAGAMVDDLVAVAHAMEGGIVKPLERKPVPARSRPGAPAAEDPASTPPPPIATSWFLSAGITRGGTRLEDLLEFTAASGVVFREMKTRESGAGVTVEGITLPLFPTRIARLADRLRVTGAVERFRAFRVIDQPGREEGA